ncbi:MAG: FAD-dependent oxidoreductase, partial [Firmicutes bacterium]|nr:FAD-dependent oxidoreductase [Bacillota bacterium]
FAVLSDSEGKIGRRQMLTALLLGAGVLGALSFLSWEKSEKIKNLLPGKDKTFGGDTYGICHICHTPHKNIPDSAQAHYDVIIAGGGISGLTAAYKLRDKKILVLEKEKKPGGCAKRNKWNDIYFAEGAAYVSSPAPLLKIFYDEIKLPLKEVKSPVDCLWINRKFIGDFWGENIKELPFGKDIKNVFKEVRDEILSFQQSGPFTVPVDASSERTLKLDKIFMSDYLKKYPPAIAKFIDDFCRDCWGIGAESLSAFAGVNFFSGSFDKTYTFPGGNGGFTDCLMGYLGGVVRTGATVTHVKRKNGKVEVGYFTEDGYTAATCDSLIFALPKLMASKIIVDIPWERKEAFSKFRYTCYLVANVMLKERIYEKAYETWFQNKIFTDIIVADYIEDSRSKKGEVLTVYMPMGETAGRKKLLRDPFSKWERTLRQDMEDVFPGINEKIVDIRLYRYGHPNVISFPGLITEICPEARKPDNGIYFAHSDSEGLPCVESAVWMGLKAAIEVNERRI